jgi:hypothetical protein
LELTQTGEIINMGVSKLKAAYIDQLNFNNISPANITND